MSRLAAPKANSPAARSAEARPVSAPLLQVTDLVKDYAMPRERLLALADTVYRQLAGSRSQ